MNNGFTYYVDDKSTLDKSGMKAALYHSSGSIHSISLCYFFVYTRVVKYDR